MRDELSEVAAMFDSKMAEQAARIVRLEEELQLQRGSDTERDSVARRQREADRHTETRRRETHMSQQSPTATDRTRSPEATSGTPRKASIIGETDTQAQKQRERGRHRDAQVVSDELDSQLQSQHAAHWSCASTNRSVVRSMAERRSPQRTAAHAPPHTPPRDDAA